MCAMSGVYDVQPGCAGTLRRQRAAAGDKGTHRPACAEDTIKRQNMNVCFDHFPVWWGVCVCGWQPDFASGEALKDQLVGHLTEHGWMVGDDDVSD